MKLKSFKESIIDIPRKTYAPGVFDDEDTNNPKIKSEIIGMIMKQFTEFKKEYPILDYSLIGSILTKRYRNDADLDINVLFDVPEDKQEVERERLSKLFLSSKNPENIQSKLIPGTKHPINYYFITDKETYESQNEKADAVFDIGKNRFIKRPEDFTFDVDMYINDFNKKVQELDIVKGELKRDIIDYNELKGLKPNDVLNLQEKIKDKLDEIEDDIEQIIKIGDGVDADRRAAFDKDMSPDEIQKFGIKNRLPKNVIYKMLEKYHYILFYKKCKKILDDGVVTDKEIDDLEMHEARRKSIAFTFGRFNPPTIGHEKLINKVASVRADDYKIFLSRSEDPKKNPLSPKEKLSIMKKMFPRHARFIEINPTNMILDICTMLYKKGYTEIFMVVGSDRVREFETIINKYNGVSSRHGKYDFDNINVLSAGERDPDAEGAVGMSASKMRAAAAKGDINSFQKGLPRGVNADDIMKAVRKGMNLAANYMYMRKAKPIASLNEFEQQQVRDLYIREQIFNVNDKVHYVKEDIHGKVVRKGTNYIVVEDGNNNLHKAWIWDCIPETDKKVDVAMREHNLNVDYGFTAVESTDIGQDYAKHTSTITPGEPSYPGYENPNYKPAKSGSGDRATKRHIKGFLEKEITDKPSEKDVKEWAVSESTIDKYKKRYKESWESKLKEVVGKMLSKI